MDSKRKKELEQPESVEKTEADTAEAVATPEQAAEKKSVPLIYVGPTIERGKLRGNTVFSAGVPEYLVKLIDRKPEIKSLIVPVDQLSATRKRLSQSGSYENTIFEKLKGAKN